MLAVLHCATPNLSEDKMAGLVRSRQHRMLAGVVGGIADYYGWNPTLLRIIFVIVSTASVAVPGILIYLILWMVMPNAGIRSDRY